MSDEARLLENKFSELLSWERVKRREGSLVAFFCYAAALSLIVLPASAVAAPGLNPLLFPAIFFAIASVATFILRSWRRRDSLRAVLLLDRTLRLEERAVTAWEILGRQPAKPAERLVLEEAWRRLETTDLKSVFKRKLGWPALAAPLLFFVWMLALWFQDELSIKAYLTGPPAPSLAQRAKEYARSLQEKSKAEGLKESLKAARTLEELADKRLRREAGEGAFLDGLSRLMRGIGGRSEQAAADLVAGTRESLSDLKSEIESLRQSLQFPRGGMDKGRPGSEVLDLLARLPQLRKELEAGSQRGTDSAPDQMQPGQLQAFLDRLEKSATEELDRMALEEINDFLASITGGGERGEGSEPLQSASGEEKGKPKRNEGKGAAQMPGHQPGSKEDSREAPPAFALNPSSHLKGLLREGETRSASVKGASRINQSRAQREDVSVTYRRQAEEELASEEIPDAMKETIKKYFLSLGMGAGGKKSDQ
ncbi:MAG: hypothetical protein ACREQK_16845 [Candidatus Binatia bacterium]